MRRRVLVALILGVLAAPAARAVPPPPVVWQRPCSVQMTTVPTVGLDGNFHAPGREWGVSPSVGGAYSIDPDDGSRRWGPVNPCVTRPVFGHPPSVLLDGTLLWMTDWNECGDGIVYAIDPATGVILRQVGGCGPHPRHTPPVDETTGEFYFGSDTFCVKDGPTFASAANGPGCAYIGGMGIIRDAVGGIVVGSYHGRGEDSCVRRYLPDGTLLAERTNPHPTLNGTSIVGRLADGSVLLNHGGTRELFAWRTDLSDLFPPVPNLMSPVVDAAGFIYAASATGRARVASLNPDGTTRWTRDLPHDWAVTDFLDAAGLLYVRACDRLYALDSATGRTEWIFRASDRIEIPVRPDGLGRLFLQDASCTHVLLDTRVQVASSIWPMAITGDPVTRDGGVRWDRGYETCTSAPVNGDPSCDAGGVTPLGCREAEVTGAVALDPDGDDVAWTWTADRADVTVEPSSGTSPGSGALPLPIVRASLSSSVPACGVTATLTLTVDDGRGGTSSCQVEVTFADDEPPALAGVPADALVECDAVPPPASVTAADACDADPSVSFAETREDGPCAGEYRLVREWTAADACGNLDRRRQVVTVQDTTPPEVTSSREVVASLWAPNHRMVRFVDSQFAPVVRDACSEPVSWRFASCASSQPDDDRGDGATTGDCVVADDGLSFSVRSERDGREPGPRLYDVAVVATDACGNESAPAVVGVVEVRHDRRDAARRGSR